MLSQCRYTIKNYSSFITVQLLSDTAMSMVTFYSTSNCAGVLTHNFKRTPINARPRGLRNTGVVQFQKSNLTFFSCYRQQNKNYSQICFNAVATAVAICLPYDVMNVTDRHIHIML